MKRYTYSLLVDISKHVRHWAQRFFVLLGGSWLLASR